MYKTFCFCFENILLCILYKLICFHLLIIVYNFFDRTFHTCLPRFEASSLGLGSDKYILDSVCRPLIRQSPLPIGKNINFEDSDDSPIVNREAINLFCMKVLFVYLVRKLHMVDYIIFACIILYMYLVYVVMC